MEFKTYQPATIVPNSITKPTVFNGSCFVRQYQIKIEEIQEDNSVIAARLLHLYRNRVSLRIQHSHNLEAMEREAKKLSIELTDL